jgi:hypothetical protein
MLTALSIRARFPIWLWLLAVALCACSQEPELAKTQVTLRVQTQGEALRASLAGLKLRVYRPAAGDWKLASEVDIATARVPWPLDVPILPSAGASEFEVVVDAFGNGGRLAQARAMSNFAAGSLRVLELVLRTCALAADGACAADDCHGSLCDTCGAGGTCEPVSVALAEDLPIYEPTRVPEDTPATDDGVKPGDAGVGADARALDAAAMGDAAPSCGANCDAGASAPLPCSGSCPATQPVCEPSMQSCVECSDDKQCPSEKGHCHQHTCLACASDAHCAAPTPHCVDQRCVTCRGPSDCAPTTETCVMGTCATRCSSNTDCPASSTCDSATSACSCNRLGLSCQGSMLVERDSCGKTIVKSGCCGQGCSGAACNPPNPRASIGCHMGNLHYLDSCDLPGAMVQDCCGQGCLTGSCRAPNPEAKRTCFNGDSYYEDSCGKRGTLAQACCGLGCTGEGLCVPVNPQATRRCYQGQAHWYDSCGTLGELLQDCQGRGCVGGVCNP